MKRIKSLVIVVLALISFGAAAQQQTSMRLNEVLVYNVDDLQNDYGVNGQWIELFNASYGIVDVAGCFLTNDPDNLTKYMIPKGDVQTKIMPRQMVLFWADSDPNKGTFYTNFNIEPGQEILFVSGDGRTIIDRVKIPSSIGESQAYARKTDGEGEWGIAKHTSPGAANVTNTAESKSQKMARLDPYGIILSITAMSVVFLALIILYRIFKRIGGLTSRKLSKKTADSDIPENVKAVAAKEEASGEVFAAIAMAYHLFAEENEAHDEESFVVTLTHTDRSYSPWSSKIYGLRETPQIKRK
ncbi:MAG: OadG family protein [Bacteroidales bacterium]|nr:OadG family protein [Bacteroidales bacterium]